MVEQMETWKQLLEVERSYNKESDDVLTEVREMEQRTQREVSPAEGCYCNVVF